MPIHKDYIQANIIFLKNDLKLSSAFNQLKNNLLDQFRNEQLFNSDITKPFYEATKAKNSKVPPKAKKTKEPPFVISNEYIDQVQLFMKIINTLHDMEEELRFLENIDPNRSTVSITAELAGRIGKTVDRLYNFFELINDAPKDLQKLIGPILNDISPKLLNALPSIESMAGAVSDTASEINTENIAKLGANIVNALPSQSSNDQTGVSLIAGAIFEIPKYLNSLNEILSIDNKSLNADQIEAKKDQAQEKIKDFLDSKKPSIYGLMSSLPAILTITTELCNTVHPLTKEAYLKSVQLLNELRHQHIPEFISQIEAIEQNIGLQPGTLSTPTLESIEQTYQKTVGIVEQLINIEGVISNLSSQANKTVGSRVLNQVGIDAKNIDSNSTPYLNEDDLIPGLNELQDHGFVQKRNDLASQKQVENIEKINQLRKIQNSATRFFERIKELDITYNADKPISVSAKDTLELALLYQEIQPFLAQRDPLLDKELVESLYISLEDRQQIILELANSDDKKAQLASALEQQPFSFSNIEAAITKFEDLSDQDKQILKQALNAEDLATNDFISKLKPEPEQNFLAGYLGSAVGIVSVFANSAMKVFDFSGTKQLKGPVDEEMDEHFQRILAVQEDVLSDIRQAANNSYYTSGIISKQKEVIKEQAKRSPNRKLFPKDFKPRPADSYLQLLESSFDANTASQKELQERLMLLKKQEKNLGVMTSAARDFFTISSVPRIKPDMKLKQLSEEDRTMLLNRFIELQPTLALMDPHNRTLENGLIEALSDENSTINDLRLHQQDVNDYISTVINTTTDEIQHLEDRLEKIQAQQTSPDSLTIYEPSEQPAASIFGAAASLHLEQKLQSFSEDTLLPTLKETVTSEVLDNLDLDNPQRTKPFGNIHESTDAEANYKRLLNAIHYLETGLTKLHELAELEQASPTDFITQGKEVLAKEIANVDMSHLKFVQKTTEMVLNIKRAIDEINIIRQHPQLKEISQEMLNIMAPIQSLPIFDDQANTPADHIEAKASNSQESSKSFVQMWDEQMNIVQGVMQSRSPPHKLSDGSAPKTDTVAPQPPIPVTQTPKTSSPIEKAHIAKPLYKLKLLLEQSKKPEQDKLSPQQLSQIDDIAIAQSENLMNFFTQGFGVFNIGKNSQQYIKGATKILEEVTDIAHLGKAMVYARLSDIPDQILGQIVETCDTAEINMGLKPGTLSNPAVEQFSKFYASLLANLDFDDQAQEVALSNMTNQMELSRIDHIEQKKATIQQKAETIKKDRSTIADNQEIIRDLQTSKADFSDTPAGRKNRIILIQAYEQLQPFLSNIDVKIFGKEYYLRKLQTTEDFTKACDQISKTEEGLFFSIYHRERGIEQNLQLCDKQIAHIQQGSLNSQIQVQRVNTFKKTLLSVEISQQLNEPENSALSKTIFANQFKAILSQKIKSEINTDELDEKSNLKQQVKSRCSDIIKQKSAELSVIRAGLMSLNETYLQLEEKLASIENSDNPYQQKTASEIKKHLQDIKTFSKRNEFDTRAFNELETNYSALQNSIKDNEVSATILKNLQAYVDEDTVNGIIKTLPGLGTESFLQNYINEKSRTFLTEATKGKYDNFMDIIHSKLCEHLQDSSVVQNNVENLFAGNIIAIDDDIKSAIDTFMQANQDNLPILVQIHEVSETVKAEKNKLPNHKTEADKVKEAYLNSIQDRIQGLETLSDFQQKTDLIDSILKDTEKMPQRFSLLENAQKITTQLDEIDTMISSNMTNLFTAEKKGQKQLIEQFKSHYKDIDKDTIDTIPSKTQALKNDIAANKKALPKLPQRQTYKIVQALFGKKIAARLFPAQAENIEKQKNLDKKVEKLISSISSVSKNTSPLTEFLTKQHAFTDKIATSIKKNYDHIANNIDSIMGILSNLETDKVASLDKVADKIIHLDANSLKEVQTALERASSLDHPLSITDLETLIERHTTVDDTNKENAVPSHSETPNYDSPPSNKL